MATLRESLLQQAKRRKGLHIFENSPKRFAEAERLVADGLFEKVRSGALDVYQLTAKGRQYMGIDKE